MIGTGIALLGLCPQGTGLSTLIIFGLIIGLGNGMYIITQNYILQKETDALMIGRVFGIHNTLVNFVMLVAPLVGGLLITVMNAGAAFLLIGIITTITGGVGIMLRRLLWKRDIEQVEE